MGDEISATAANILTSYRTVDAGLAPLLKKYPVTCSKGCTGCCYLLAMVAFSDGVLIAEHLLSGEMGPLDPWLERLTKQAWATMGLDARGVTTLDYVRKKVPCAFLDPETRLCQVYDRRPVTCRAHYVITDPKLCSPDNETEKIASLDTFPIEIQLHNSIPMNRSKNGLPFTAPIPIMVLLALQVIAKQRGDQPLLDRVCEAARGIPDPEEYILNSHEMTDRTHAERLADHGRLP